MAAALHLTPRRRRRFIIYQMLKTRLQVYVHGEERLYEGNRLMWNTELADWQ
jgi:hypothetical protein